MASKMVKSTDPSLKCCLKDCKDPKISLASGRVEVRSFASKKNASMICDWTSEGEAMFHADCWREVNKACQQAGHDIIPTECEMVREAKETAEYFDSEGKIQTEAKRFARLLRDSKHCIAFTGAGISTAAGIGDFRGKSGKWTERDKQKKYGPSKGSKKGSRSYKQLRPTYTHEAISKLVQMGFIKFVISQNVDGIHRLSEVPRDKISELHGNVFHEKCENCGTVYERPYSYRDQRKVITNAPVKKCSKCRINHRTGRKCEVKGCNGFLMNTVINFGDHLDEDVLSTATDHAQKNDLCLCLGSTLRVTPACDLVEMGRPLRLTICNRQTTPFDEMCQQGCRVYGDCDTFMREVMKCILDDEVTEWEEGREDRMKRYDERREG